jgi:hypothetical protein
MVVRLGRVVAAVAVMLTFLVNVRPGMGTVPKLLRPIASVGNAVSTTTKKVAKTSVATLNKAVAAPKKMLNKVSSTVTGKKLK